MKQAEKALRDAGWEQVTRSDVELGEEYYDLKAGRVTKAGSALVGEPMQNYIVLRAPRPEPEYEPGTVVWANTSDGEQAVTSVGLHGAMRWIGKSPNGLAAVYSQGVEVLRVIAHPDGSTDLTRAINVTRVEVIDDKGRAYINTEAKDVEFSFQDGGRTLKVFTGGTGVAPRPGDSFGKCTPDIDAINERADARARELLERLWEKLDEKDDTK